MSLKTKLLLSFASAFSMFLLVFVYDWLRYSHLAEEMFLVIFVALFSALFLLFLVYRSLFVPLENIKYILENRDEEMLRKMLDRGDEFSHIAGVIVNFFHQNMILEQYKEAIDTSSIVSKTDKMGIITYANDEFCRISGFSREELIGKNHNIVRHPDNNKEFFEAVWKKIKSGKTFVGVIKNRAKNGDVYFVRSVILPILSSNGEIEEYISIRTDVTEMFEQMNLIMGQTTDRLTGLPNKQQLLQDMEERRDKMFVLINISGFRGINESFGHEVGDNILIAFSYRVRHLLPLSSSLYRVSGDEFAAVFDSYDSASAKIISEVVSADIESSPFKAGDGEITLCVRVAAARGDELLHQKCDMAMNYAKSHNLSFVDFDENDQIQAELEMSKEVTKLVQQAIKFDFIHIYGQKVIEASDMKSYKIETLMRIIGTDGNVISPGIFLQQAKSSRLYSKLTQILIKKSFEYFKDNSLQFSVNFTFEDILNKDTVELLFDSIRKYSMYGRVVVEIVESESIGTNMEIEQFVISAKELGCLISIDDFGSGYSNFDYILRMGADILKIDGSLIKNLSHDMNAYLTVKTIVSLAKEIGLKTVAEYIHSKDVLDIVLSLGIDYLQGYYLHEPEPLECIS